MTRELIDFTSFDEAQSVGFIGRSSRNLGATAHLWAGSATSLVTGWNGSGQAVRGPAALQLNVNYSGGSTYTSVGVKGKVRFNTLGVAQDVVSFNAGLSQSCVLGLNSSNQWILAGAVSGGATQTSSTTPTISTWYDFEVAVYLHNTNGRFRVLLDGQEIAALTATNQDTIYSAATVWTQLYFNNANIDLDDLVFWGDTGEFGDDHFLSGSARGVGMISLHPIGPGAYSGGTNVTGTGAANWEEIDEAINDAATSYLRMGSGTRDSVVVETMVDDPDIAQILMVRSCVVNETEPATSQGNAFIRYDGVDYDGIGGGSGEATGSDTWLADRDWFRADFWPTDPSTSAAWSDQLPTDCIAVINELEVGFEQTGSAFFPTLVSQIVLQVLYITGTTRSTGIVLRGAYDAAGDITKGYVCQLDYSPFGDIDAVVRRVVASTSVDLATAPVTTGYGLAFDQNYELRASIENIGGTNPANGQPAITVKIDGATVSGWTSLLAGIDIGDDDEVIDETASAILSGSSQGLYLAPPASGAGFLYYSLWSDDFEPDPGDTPPSDENTIPVGMECDGKTGTFSAPVGSQISVEVGSRVAQHRYETQHVARILQDPQQRRRWRIELPAGMTTTEKTDLWTFWNDHGKSIPFDFADPETGDLVCAHFFDDSLATVKAAPASNSYECVIEELLDSPSLLQIVTSTRKVFLTTYAPSIGVANPAAASLTTTRYAPVLSLRITPTTATKTITTFAPIIRLSVIPPTIALTIVRTAPTVTGP